MSAFGALPLDACAVTCRCGRGFVEQVHRGRAGPGLRHFAGATCWPLRKGNATTLVLDLHDQWSNFGKTGQYRFTPPTHVIVALHQALEEFAAEGGVSGRGERYREKLPHPARRHDGAGI